MRAKDWERACTLWAEVRALRPVHPGAYIEGLESLIRAYRFDEIEPVAEAARKHVGDQFNVQMFLAKLETRQGKWGSSVKSFEQMAASFPRRAAEVLGTTSYRQSVLNHSGIIEGNQTLDLLTHAGFQNREDLDNAEAHPKEYIFVSGMPRAGTTALGHMLNAVPEVALFTEIHIPYLAYSEACFHPDFLTYRAERLPPAAPGNLIERSKTAKYIGDKRPLMHYMLPQTLEVLKNRNVYVLHILRSVLLVANSYQTRASNPQDEWDPLRGLNNVIDELNVTHQWIVDQAELSLRPQHVLKFVDYSKMFTDCDYALGILETVGIETDEKIRSKVQGFIEQSSNIIKNQRTIPEDVVETVKARLDLDLAKQVEQITGISILGDLSL